MIYVHVGFNCTLPKTWYKMHVYICITNTRRLFDMQHVLNRYSLFVNVIYRFHVNMGTYWCVALRPAFNIPRDCQATKTHGLKANIYVRIDKFTSALISCGLLFPYIWFDLIYFLFNLLDSLVCNEIHHVIYITNDY